MSLVETMARVYEFNRERTLGLLETIEKTIDPMSVLSWRPGPGRAHIGWQLTHVGVTEDIFGSERLVPEKTGAFAELWPRFRGGSTPDDDIPSPAAIRQVLDRSRQNLLATLANYGDDRLEEIPAAFAARNFTVRTVLHIINWHEAHHQGQCHLTLNLHKAAHPRH